MTVRTHVSAGIATLTLDRPDRLNALTEPMLEALLAALQAASVDPAIRCVVLAGAGRGFCAGYDLGDHGDVAREWRVDEAAARMMLNAQIPMLLKRMPKPTIASIRGPCAGSGVVLAAACDLRIASTTARFKLAFASAGRCGDPGGSYLLTKLVGAARARVLFLLDDEIDAAHALEIGLVSRLFADEALDAETRSLAVRLAEGPTAAFAAMKRNLNAVEISAFEESMASEASANAALSLSRDGKEAAQAFMEKRPARFRGY